MELVEDPVRKLLMCRLCSTQGQGDSGIMAFSDEGLIRCVQQHIKKYLYITITMDDKFTKFICIGCLRTLEGFHQFASMATQTQKKFIQATKVQRVHSEDNHGLLHAYLTNTTKETVISDHDYASNDKKETETEIKKPSRKRKTARRRTKEKTTVIQELTLINNSDSNTHETLEVIVDPTLYLDVLDDSLYQENNNNTLEDIANMEFTDVPEQSEWPCPICGRAEFTSNELKLHLRIHRPKGKHECNICKRVFKTSANLVQHKIYHDGGQFKCETCQRMYPTSSTLKAHAITHSDLRPHQCQLCQKSFKRNQDLKFHMNQHTGERPYKCIYCPKAFASSGNCFSHRKRMHPDEVERDRNFAANICR